MVLYHQRKATDPVWWERFRATLRRNKLARKYGITEADVEAAYVRQGGKCGLCAKEPTDKDKLVIDHDHVTGKFRGLLHRSCNVALGVLGDNVTALRRAIYYLEGMP